MKDLKFHPIFFLSEIKGDINSNKKCTRSQREKMHNEDVMGHNKDKEF